MKNYIGLTYKQVDKSHEIHGSNLVKHTSKSRYVKALLKAPLSPVSSIMFILLCMVIMIEDAYKVDYHSLYSIDPILVILIFWIITIVVNAVNAISITRLLKDDSFENNFPVPVIRDSATVTIPRSEIVVGDLVVMKTGMKVPANGEFIETENLEVNGKAALDGYIVERGDEVTSGEGVLRVRSVKNDSVKHIYPSVDTDFGDSVSNNLKSFTSTLSIIAWINGFLAIILYLSYYFIGTRYSTQTFIPVLLQSVIAGIAIVAMITPINIPLQFGALMATIFRVLRVNKIEVRRLSGLFKILNNNSDSSEVSATVPVKYTNDPNVYTTSSGVKVCTYIAPEREIENADFIVDTINSATLGRLRLISASLIATVKKILVFQMILGFTLAGTVIFSAAANIAMPLSLTDMLLVDICFGCISAGIYSLVFMNKVRKLLKVPAEELEEVHVDKEDGERILTSRSNKFIIVNSVIAVILILCAYAGVCLPYLNSVFAENTIIGATSVYVTSAGHLLLLAVTIVIFLAEFFIVGNRFRRK